MPVFDATRTHERDGPAAFLADFRGKLQADAYTGYDGLYETGRVLEIGCWAHARRGFVEAFMIDPAAALMIALIRQLYDVERDAADLDPDDRRAVRQERSVPVLTTIDAERQALARTVLPKSPLGDAVRYLTNQWAALLARHPLHANDLLIARSFSRSSRPHFVTSSRRGSSDAYLQQADPAVSPAQLTPS